MDAVVPGGPESASASTSSWLCANEQDRRRLLDMAGRLRNARVLAFVAMAITALATAPWIGFVTLVPYACAAVVFRITDSRLADSPRPEYWMFAGWAFCQLMIAVAAVTSGEANSVYVFWLSVPTVTLAARFSNAGLWAGIALTGALIVGTIVITDPAAAAHEPYRIIAPLSALFGLAALSRPLQRSDLEHRAGATTDALTGLANRAALERDAPELLARARRAGLPVGVLVGDLDHFKAINDRFGHDRGDEVLRDAADAMQGVMRSFDRLYRIGGEEFLVLLSGADLTSAAEVAERLRVAVAEREPGGLEVSMSVGVSAAAGHDDLVTLLRDADRALYDAKRAGRDRVRVAPPATIAA
ncbi:MAG TPA: GGDEF domain-containing protein [Baekduia sp.]|nr:GGDEF domain-containing protein [Baekduia sp.]